MQGSCRVLYRTPKSLGPSKHGIGLGQRETVGSTVVASAHSTQRAQMPRRRQRPLQHPSSRASPAPSRHPGRSNNAGTNTQSTTAQTRGTDASSTATQRTRLPR
uniref:Transferase, transferring glycosyl groups / transferase, transferring hexosyl groups n=1 Tax=Arundo donax TaxID=35708 RepID=A0A0A9D6B1_ARUDO